VTDEREDIQSTARDVLLAQRLVELADTLVADYDVVDLLDTLVHTCVEVLPTSQAGLLLLQGKRLEVLASTNEGTRILELFQLHGEAGPCYEAATTGRSVSIDDLSADGQRWPKFAQAAQRTGFYSVHAIPMKLRDETIGALNLFGDLGHVLSDEDRKVGKAIADIATIGILQQRSIHRISLVAEQLQAALTSRVIIEQAKGLLAEFAQLDMESAFRAMRQYSREHNLKMSRVADQLVQRRLDPAVVINKSPNTPIQRS
jgi:GAF domain-containing protein